MPQSRIAGVGGQGLKQEQRRQGRSWSSLLRVLFTNSDRQTAGGPWLQSRTARGDGIPQAGRALKTAHRHHGHMDVLLGWPRPGSRLNNRALVFKHGSMRSEPDIRNSIRKSSPQTSLILSHTIMGNRARFSMLPPNSSVRWLNRGR